MFRRSYIAQWIDGGINRWKQVTCLASTCNFSQREPHTVCPCAVHSIPPESVVQTFPYDTSSNHIASPIALPILSSSSSSSLNGSSQFRIGSSSRHTYLTRRINTVRSLSAAQCPFHPAERSLIHRCCNFLWVGGWLVKLGEGGSLHLFSPVLPRASPQLPHRISAMDSPPAKLSASSLEIP